MLTASSSQLSLRELSTDEVDAMLRRLAFLSVPSAAFSSSASVTTIEHCAAAWHVSSIDWNFSILLLMLRLCASTISWAELRWLLTLSLFRSQSGNHRTTKKSLLKRPKQVKVFTGNVVNVGEPKSNINFFGDRNQTNDVEKKKKERKLMK